jgi:hypothetical protein
MPSDTRKSNATEDNTGQKIVIQIPPSAGLLLALNVIQKKDQSLHLQKSLNQRMPATGKEHRA